MWSSISERELRGLSDCAHSVRVHICCPPDVSQGVSQQTAAQVAPAGFPKWGCAGPQAHPFTCGLWLLPCCSVELSNCNRPCQPWSFATSISREMWSILLMNCTIADRILVRSWGRDGEYGVCLCVSFKLSGPHMCKGYSEETNQSWLRRSFSRSVLFKFYFILICISGICVTFFTLKMIARRNGE